MKTLRVIVCFEFDGIKDPDSPAADRIINSITDDTEKWRTDHGASFAYVNEAAIVEIKEENAA